MAVTKIEATTQIKGAVTVANGGTGTNSLTAHGLVVGNGTGIVKVTSAGTAGQVLTSNGASSDPTFQTVSAVPVAPTVCFATDFSTLGRLTTVTDGVHGSTTVGSGIDGVEIKCDGNSTAFAGVQYNGSEYVKYSTTWNTLFSAVLSNIPSPTNMEIFVGIGNPANAASGMTWTNSHIGFKIVQSGGNTLLYGSCADGTTEAVSASHIIGYGVLRLCFRYNTNDTIDFWYQDGNHAWSSKFSLSTNIPYSLQGGKVAINPVSTASLIDITANSMSIMIF